MVEEVVFLRDNKYTVFCEKYEVRDKKRERQKAQRLTEQ